MIEEIHARFREGLRMPFGISPMGVCSKPQLPYYREPLPLHDDPLCPKVAFAEMLTVYWVRNS